MDHYTFISTVFQLHLIMCLRCDIHFNGQIKFNFEEDANLAIIELFYLDIQRINVGRHLIKNLIR